MWGTTMYDNGKQMVLKEAYGGTTDKLNLGKGPLMMQGKVKWGVLLSRKTPITRQVIMSRIKIGWDNRKGVDAPTNHSFARTISKP